MATDGSDISMNASFGGDLFQELDTDRMRAKISGASTKLLQIIALTFLRLREAHVGSVIEVIGTGLADITGHPSTGSIYDKVSDSLDLCCSGSARSLSVASEPEYGVLVPVAITIMLKVDRPSLETAVYTLVHNAIIGPTQDEYQWAMEVVATISSNEFTTVDINTLYSDLLKMDGDIRERYLARLSSEELEAVSVKAGKATHNRKAREQVAALLLKTQAEAT